MVAIQNFLFVMDISCFCFRFRSVVIHRSRLIGDKKLNVCTLRRGESSAYAAVGMEGVRTYPRFCPFRCVLMLLSPSTPLLSLFYGRTQVRCGRAKGNQTAHGQEILVYKQLSGDSNVIPPSSPQPNSDFIHTHTQTPVNRRCGLPIRSSYFAVSGSGSSNRGLFFFFARQ